MRRLLLSLGQDLRLKAEQAQHGEDVEALHELRIAVRKTRTLLRAFRKLLKPTVARKLDHDLRRLNRSVGPARDLDVWIARLQSPLLARALARSRSATAYRNRQLAEQSRYRQQVRRILRGRRFRATCARMERLLDPEFPPLIAETPGGSCETAAQDALAHQFRRVRRAAPLRKHPDPEKRHRLRIALRRLRYLAGFFAPLLGRDIERLRKRAHVVERLLGRMRDATSALARLPNEPAPAFELLRRQLQQETVKADAQLEQAWRRLADRDFRRRLRF